ncbi:MAG TPA: hypothetical protein VFQ65_32615 [Kofleriaceae bacterium]|nr:hypothetical protein [Kofleriaceae bacterium]
MKTLSTFLFLAAGCTMMVNGKPHRIGGSDPDPQPQASAAAPAPAATTGGAAKAPAAAVVGKPGQLITIDAALTATPKVTDIGQVGFDTTYGHVFGISGNSPDCGNDMTSQPIASIELKQAVPQMELTVEGGSNDGFVLRNAKSVWFACEGTIGGVPSISSLKEGWQPGRYDIYAVSRYGKNANRPFTVEVSDSSKPAAWPDKLKTISLPGKLATPMFVEVTTQPNRRVARAARSGWGCEKDAFANDPDLALVLERPIPGLVVRPLPSATPVNLRREARDAKKANKGCPTFNHDGNGGGPSYHATHELHFDKEDEGTFGISLGTADATKPTTVTLMIYDASTKLDALAPFAGGATATLEDRWLGRTFPQLDLRELDQHSYAHQELTAKAFALAPKTTFVYAKLDLDKDIASGDSDSFPVKNEALLVTGVENGRVDVLTADGLHFRVKDTHVLLAPEGAAVVPAAPRALHKLDLGQAMNMLPPTAKNLAAAHDKRIAAHEACVDRVWAPFGRQLPTYTHPAGVEIVTYESPRERAIKDAGNNAVDRQCGTAESVDKGSEQERVKMVAAIEKARAKLLAESTAAWH